MDSSMNYRSWTATELQQRHERAKKRREASELPDFTCSKCGKTAVPSHYVYYAAWEMVELSMCIMCTHWHAVHKMVLKDPKTHFVARDNAYTVGDENLAKNLQRGFGGALFIIRFPDGAIVESTNLWHRGAVPTEWQEDLPNTAFFLRG